MSPQNTDSIFDPLKRVQTPARSLPEANFPEESLSKELVLESERPQKTPQGTPQRTPQGHSEDTSAERSFLCCTYCTASSYSHKLIYAAFKARYPATCYRDVVHLELPSGNSLMPCIDLFCFDLGAVVFWGWGADEARPFLRELVPFENGSLVDVEVDSFSYLVGKGTTAMIVDEEIQLPDDEIHARLALSYAMAQSVRLGVFEEAIQRSFDQAKHIPEELAAKGRIALSRREIRKKIGELFLVRSSIRLHLDALDTPEFLWDYPEYEPFYKLMADHLDLKTRGEVLDQRLTVSHELFDVLASELNHQQSARLEWTIIWLILIEVTLILVHDVLGLL